MHSVRLRCRRRFRQGALAAVAAASLLVGVVGPAAPAQAAEITDGLALWYKLDATSGTVAADASGNGRNGTVNGTAGWSGNGEGLTFNGSSTYIKVPDNIMSGMNSITVSMDVQIDAAQATPYFIYGFGNTASSGTGNGYLFTTGNSFRTAIASGNSSTEQNTRTSAALQRSVWKHVTYTQTGTTGVLYEDGVEKARNTSVTLTPGSIGSGTTTANYVGKSVYTSDKLFKGRIRDFRVYNRALAPGEVLAVSGNTTGIGAATHPKLKIDAIVDNTTSKITLPLTEGTDLTTLAPQFTIAHGAAISPASGTPRDFTDPVTYEVSDSDGEKRTWTVEALIMKSPVLPGLTADPNIVRFGDTFYLYPTTDGFAGWSGTKFHAYSSKDLVHWTDHGVILDLGPDVSWADARAWAPTTAEKNGKYYFYYSADTNIGVAVADSPTGPFTDPLGKPLIARGAFTGQMIDPAVFTDDDGKRYLYWGNSRAYVVPLNDDMVSFDASKVTDITPSGYNEGTFVVKRSSTYYFMWSENDTRDENYRVAYATGPSPTGPWTKRGIILEKDLSLGIKGPGHHSVVHVPGTDDWYIAYHRFAIPGGDGTHRETTVDKLEFDADGLIKKVVPTLTSIDPVTVVHAGPDADGTEGDAIRIDGTVSGAGGPKWTVQQGAPCTFADAGAARTTITCTDNGTYEVTLTGGRSSDTATVTVANAAPAITSAQGPKSPVAAGSRTVVTTAFGDPGTGDTHTCAVDWKDGTEPTAGTVTASTCTASHTYTSAGIRRPEVTVTDDDGGSDRTTLPELVVYDRGAGPASGVGVMTSPAGAYPAGPALTGLAAFSFAADYKKGATVPSGTATFDFGAARLKFRSTGSDWLVVTGTRAVYQGSGTVGGTAGYGFRVTATDGPDTFRIEIWKKATGAVVYDNTAAAKAIGVVTVAGRRL